jgi:Zn-dependent membrane protease YugP
VLLPFPFVDATYLLFALPALLLALYAQFKVQRTYGKYAGLLTQATGLAVLGLVLFSSAAVFALVTLPVELNASRRALALLDATGLVTPRELDAAKEVLDAAALTYVAGLAQSVAQVFYFLHLLVGHRQEAEEQ